jgi:beta-glucanase (GH16 family)
MKSMSSILLVFIVSLLSSCSKDSGGGGTAPQPATNPKISISDVFLPEGNTASQFNFNVTLDKTSTKTVTVNLNTTEGFAKAGQDFTATTQTLSFAPGETTKVVPISVVGDDIKEGTDDFTVVLSSPSNATISKAIGIANILNDDSRVAFANTGYDAPATYPGYTLAWADEFNGSSLNSTDWTFENGDGCPGNCGWGNNELEYYQPGNLSFQDGKLIIEAKKETVGNKPYTSSKIVSRGKKFFKFGRIDFRAILPKGKGIWPAFWMMPQDNVYGGWPRSGELDIMENIGHEPNRTYGTLHFGPGPGSTQLGRSYTLPSGIFNDQFHVFSIEWKQNEIKWLVDNVVYSTYTNADFGSNNYPFNENFYFIVNLAVGGNWPGNPDGTTYIPQFLIVDYLRVYQ